MKTIKLWNKKMISFISFVKGHLKSKEGSEKNYFAVIADLLSFSINRQNKTIEETISRFMYSAFDKKRDLSNEIAVEYPNEYYEALYKATKELAPIKDNKLTILGHRISSLVWLFGEYSDTKIHETTYGWIWIILRVPIEYGNDDMVLNYWSTAHQYYRYHLHKIVHEYSDKWEVINQENIDLREKERIRFLEFHYALGGLLLYKKRYSCLFRIFNYTTSIPPDYSPLPKMMNEIFQYYFYFRDPFDFNIKFISSKYNFPNIEGLHADSQIKKWVSKYIVLLFIRQWNIDSHLTIENPLEYPKLPETQMEKSFWLLNMDFFEMLMNELLSDKILMSDLGLDFINHKWCKDNKKLSPIEFIIKFKEKLSASIKNTLLTQEVSVKKQSKFYGSTKVILVKAFSEYKVINNENFKSSTDFTSYYSRGIKSLFDKSAFADYQEADNINYDSFLAEGLAEKFKTSISETFFLNKSVDYILKEEDIFKGIDKLNLDDKQFVIISFRQNLDYYKRQYGILGLDSEIYKNINIINFDVCNYPLVGGSFFILRKEDLPFIEFKPIEKEEIEKYNLSLIDKNYNIYSNILDLNKPEHKGLGAELSKMKPGEDIEKYVLAIILYNAEIKWKKNINCVQIKVYSKYEQQGLPNSLDDIKKF